MDYTEEEEARARKYRMKQFLDYGDQNYIAEKQVEKAYLAGLRDREDILESDLKKGFIKCPRCRGKGQVKRKVIRSMEQNKYYWGVIVLMVGLEMGEDKDNVHEILKQKFNPVRKVLADQTITEFGGSTSTMDTKQFSEYISLIKRWCFEFMNLTIPEPDSLDEGFLEDVEGVLFP